MTALRHSTLTLFLILGSSVSLPAADPSGQDDSAAIVRHFVRPEKPAPAFVDGKFDPRPGETITLIGGATVFGMQEHGYFELALQRAFPDRGLKLRNVAWHADTVYRQQRPLYFFTEKGDTRPGSVPDQRQRIEPGILILRFGKMESLDGLESLGAFIAAYRNLLDELAPFSRRIVLAGPERFFESGPAAKLAGERNEVLTAYAGAIRNLAGERGLLYAELFDSAESAPAAPEDLSRNGVDLTATGQRWVAKNLARELGIEAASEISAEKEEAIRGAIVEKNRLWHQYYRPTNWAFLFGDRQHVPSSRDDKNSDRRWFIEELNRLPSLIAEEESKMSRLVR